MSRFDRFENINGPRRLNRFAQVLLAILFIAGLNWLSFSHYTRMDITGAYSLSAESVVRLRQLRASGAEVEIFWTFSAGSTVKGEPELVARLRPLLEEYELNGRQGNERRIKVTHVDTLRDRAATDELARRFRIKDPRAVIVASGSKSRVITPAELMVADSSGAISAFKAEQVITSAIIDVTSQRSNRVVFVQGHGEMLPGNPDRDRGLSEFAGQLALRNITVDVVNLANEERLNPENTSLVIIAAPIAPFPAREVEVLRRYLEQSGRVLLLADGIHQHGLDRLLAEWGVVTDNMVVVEMAADNLAAGREILVKRFPDKCPATDMLVNLKMPLVAGTARPVRAIPELSGDPRMRYATLLATSNESWGESAYSEPRARWSYQRASDMPGPVPLAVSAERLAGDSLSINLRGGRLIVVGFGDLMVNRAFANSPGNQFLSLGLVNWCLEQDFMLAVPPQTLDRVQIPLSGEQFQRCAVVIATIPLALAMLGFVIHWRRKA